MIRRLVAATVLLALGASAAGAQSIELQLREDLNRAPVGGAIVRLLSDGRVVVQGLTSAQGRITLPAPRPGSYSIKADRIGFTGVIVGPIELAQGETLRREILMPSTRIELPTVVVRGSNQCETKGAAGTVAVALWEEINKALTANVLTGRQGSIPLVVRKFVREADRNGTVQRQWVWASQLTSGQPFSSLPPAALAQRGFIEDEGDSVTYAAPDAALLLSDEFVSTHCFRAEPGRGELVGLSFEPMPGRKLKDVRGTLWVNRATDELQFLEYGYTGISGELAKTGLGGRVEFRRLPSGAWIVSYWHIRMPHMETLFVRGPMNTQSEITRHTGYIDQGGRTVIAGDLMGRVDVSMVMGRVLDSTAGRGLPGAVITVQGYRDSAISDGDGRYQLTLPAAGDLVLLVSHPRLGLARDLTGKEALLSLGDTTVVNFAVPSLGTFARTYCGGNSGRPGLVGIAWGDQAPAEGLTVRVTWLGVNGGVREEMSVSGRRGLYASCNLPSGPTLTVRLQDGVKPLSEQRVKLEQGEFLWLELKPYWVPTITAAALPHGSQAAVAGTVRRDSTGRPLSRVEVLVEGSQHKTATDNDGKYVLAGLSPGQHVILFRAVGSRPVRLRVGLVPGDTTTADAELVPMAVELAPIEVTASGRVLTGLEAIEERKKMGMGRYIDSTELRKWEHLSLPDLLRRDSGIRLIQGVIAASARRGTNTGGACYMQIILDGVVLYRNVTHEFPSSGSPQSPPPNLKYEFDVASLQAVEIYRSAAETPAEFNGSGAGCGTIVMWTRR